MNRLIPPQDIGMPYHGLALNGQATVGLKTVSVNGTGPCTVVRHPSALGNRRNIQQQTRDGTLGFEWRDYALLCGYNRAVNGGPEIGAGSWLYCDPAGSTWLMKIQQSIIDNTPDVTNQKTRLEVVCQSLFGRFGRTGPDPFVLATLDWVPTFPSWYISGPVEPYMMANNLICSNELAVVPNQDGSNVIINAHTTNGTIIDEVYVEAQAHLDNNQRYALVGVLRVEVSGSGDLDTGAGLSATLAVEDEYEALVVDRTVILNYSDPYPVFSAPFVDVSPESVWGPADGYPEDTIKEITTTSTWQLDSGSTTFRRNVTSTDTRAVIYRRHEGNIVREYIREYAIDWYQNRTGTFSQTTTWRAVSQPGGGKSWEFEACRDESNDRGYTQTATEVDRLYEQYDIFGTVVGIQALDQRYYSETTPNDLCHPDSVVETNCGCVASSVSASLTETDTVTCNGLTYADSMTLAEMDPGVRIFMLSSGTFNVVADFIKPDEVNRQEESTVLGVGDGTLNTLETRIESYADGGTPPDWLWYVSYQPVTEESTVNEFGVGNDVPQYF